MTVDELIDELQLLDVPGDAKIVVIPRQSYSYDDLAEQIPLETVDAYGYVDSAHAFVLGARR